MRIGFGYDVHSFVEGRELFLGGIRIPHEKGLLGHSDGDVLMHAISDALLGAMAEGDIGLLFPDTDPSIKGIDSRKILNSVLQIVRERRFTIANVDAVLVCEAPRVASFRDSIRESLAQTMALTIDRISVKGKTSEGLGFVGRREAIEAYAVCLLEG
jgi:2-C-methyl-D-erythritol 2,4-cyclodiphosphate synthase